MPSKNLDGSTFDAKSVFDTDRVENLYDFLPNSGP